MYVVVSVFILPWNRDGIRLCGVLGAVLLAFLLCYGTEAFCRI